MDHTDPNYEFDCPNFVSFNGDDSEEASSSYFDIDHQTGQRLSQLFLDAFESGLEDECFKENIPGENEKLNDNEKNKRTSQAKRKSCTNYLYELRATPSRVQRLSMLSPKDPEFTRMSAMLTPNILRSHGNATPQNRLGPSRKSLFSKQRVGATPLKNVSNAILETLNDGSDRTPTTLEKNVPEKVKQVRFAPDGNRLSIPVGFKIPPTPYASSKKPLAGSSLKQPTKSRIHHLSWSSPSGTHSRYMPQRKMFGSSQKPSGAFKRDTPHDRKIISSVKKATNTSKMSFGCSRRNTISDESLSSEHFEVNRAAFGDGKNSSNKLKVTAPKPFHFETDKRIKVHDPFASAKKEVDFVKNLRHNSPRNRTPRLTEFKPFSFDQVPMGNKHSVTRTEKTMAEKVLLFNKTPERFRSKAANTEFQSKESTHLELTKPHSPKLLAGKRTRPARVVSQAELEEQDVTDMKNYEFHAQPLNKKIFDTPNLSKPEVKKPTKPVDVHLNTETRAAVHKKPQQDEPYVFHAQEIPKNLFKEPLGVHVKRAIPLTEPKSPAFALKQRYQEWKISTAELLEEPNCTIHIKANPVPNFRSPFTVKKTTKVTTAEPFSFENHDKTRYALKQKRIREEIENEKKLASGFHANPLPPTPTPRRQMKVAKKQLTKPIPFNFASDSLEKKTVSAREESHVMHFKAQPASVVKKRPFIPKKQNRSIKVASKLHLSTEERATKRMKLKELQETIEAENELLQQKLQEDELQKEKERMRQLRQELVHKANPIRQFKQVRVKPSDKPLTVPKSPRFSNLRSDSRVE